MADLIFHSGPLSGTRVQVVREMLLGRESVDVVIEDSEVSRRHARVRPVGAGLEIEDVGSRNGTWVNGFRIDRPTVVSIGDAIRVGTSTITVEPGPAASGAPSVSAAPPPQAPPPPQPAQAPPPSVRPPDPGPPAAGFQAPPAPGGRRPAATRSLVPLVASFGVILVTAVLLLVYFATRTSP